MNSPSTSTNGIGGTRARRRATARSGRAAAPIGGAGAEIATLVLTSAIANRSRPQACSERRRRTAPSSPPKRRGILAQSPPSRALRTCRGRCRSRRPCARSGSGVAADLVGDLVPAGLDALGRLLRGDVLVHHVGEIVVEDLEVLVVALDQQQRGGILRVLDRRLDHVRRRTGRGWPCAVRFDWRKGSQKPLGWATASSPMLGLVNHWMKR